MLQQATAYSQFISQRIRLPGLPNQLPPEAVPVASSTASSSTGRSTTPNKNKGKGKSGKRPRPEESEVRSLPPPGGGAHTNHTAGGMPSAARGLTVAAHTYTHATEGRG
jgi:hypothetical protein